MAWGAANIPTSATTGDIYTITLSNNSANITSSTVLDFPSQTATAGPTSNYPENQLTLDLDIEPAPPPLPPVWPRIRKPAPESLRGWQGQRRMLLLVQTLPRLGQRRIRRSMTTAQKRTARRHSW